MLGDDEQNLKGRFFAPVSGSITTRFYRSSGFSRFSTPSKGMGLDMSSSFESSVLKRYPWVGFAIPQGCLGKSHLPPSPAPDTLLPMASPFKLDQPLPITRTTDGRFQEMRRDMDRAVPPNPLEVEQGGQQPKAWAPGIGQGTAPTRGLSIPWPPARNDKSPIK